MSNEAMQAMIEKSNKFSDVLDEINAQKNEFKHVSDVFPYILKHEFDEVDEMYEKREETKELNNVRALIREQKRKFQSALDSFKSIDEDMAIYLFLDDSKELKKNLYNAYNYCLDKGFLDFAKKYLALLYEWDIDVISLMMITLKKKF